MKRFTCSFATAAGVRDRITVLARTSCDAILIAIEHFGAVRCSARPAARGEA